MAKHGGEMVGQVLKNFGVEFLFTLCGGHISPILSGAKGLGIRVVDVRHEANAVFAADAVARLTGVPGVAAVTAGPGVTNTVTAVKNAQMAQSPVLVLGGATATMLRGRGSLQDIDQMALMKPHVKWATGVTTVRDLVPTVERALLIAQADVPGPVFVECPVDLLYDEATVRSLYPFQDKKPKGLGQRLQALYVNRHLSNLFARADRVSFAEGRRVGPPEPTPASVETAFSFLALAHRPVLVAGSQVVQRPEAASAVVAAIEKLGLPTYLGGMARGLLGANHPQQLRHQRKAALKEADLVILAGAPCDFRLDYGRSINAKATLVSVNRSARQLKLNRRPTLGIRADPGLFLERLAADVERDGDEWIDWLAALRQRDDDREAQIAEQAAQETDFLNPLALCRAIDEALDEDSVLVADGGDFVGTASYIVRPRGPLRWLDPGAFGTLGVGGGFALGAKLCRPSAEVWILYGDGSCGYTLAEFDSFVRHGVPVIAVVGNDACWMQILREQIEVLEDDVGCRLSRTPYGEVVEGFGAKGLQLERPEDIPSVLSQAKELAAAGHPVLINALLGATDFRKGSISM
ncbi:MAG: thiamine pyrophosphate-binding protein [Acidobacteria bacterium]|nr:thiamine pyrophosphate-binding protein [Acidobacteriota bacterium]